MCYCQHHYTWMLQKWKFLYLLYVQFYVKLFTVWQNEKLFLSVFWWHIICDVEMPYSLTRCGTINIYILPIYVYHILWQDVLSTYIFCPYMIYVYHILWQDVLSTSLYLNVTFCLFFYFVTNNSSIVPH